MNFGNHGRSCGRTCQSGFILDVARLDVVCLRAGRAYRPRAALVGGCTTGIAVWMAIVGPATGPPSVAIPAAEPDR